MKKLYCYVDETGQDTKGNIFIFEPEYLAACCEDEWFEKNLPEGILRSLLRSSSLYQ